MLQVPKKNCCSGYRIQLDAKTLCLDHVLGCTRVLPAGFHSHALQHRYVFVDMYQVITSMDLCAVQVHLQAR